MPMGRGCTGEGDTVGTPPSHVSGVLSASCSSRISVRAQAKIGCFSFTRREKCTCFGSSIKCVWKEFNP